MQSQEPRRISLRRICEEFLRSPADDILLGYPRPEDGEDEAAVFDILHHAGKLLFQPRTIDPRTVRHMNATWNRIHIKTQLVPMTHEDAVSGISIMLYELPGRLFISTVMSLLLGETAKIQNIDASIGHKVTYITEVFTHLLSRLIGQGRAEEVIIRMYPAWTDLCVALLQDMVRVHRVGLRLPRPEELLLLDNDSSSGSGGDSKKNTSSYSTPDMISDGLPTCTQVHTMPPHRHPLSTGRLSLYPSEPTRTVSLGGEACSPSGRCSTEERDLQLAIELSLQGQEERGGRPITISKSNSIGSSNSSSTIRARSQHQNVEPAHFALPQNAQEAIDNVLANLTAKDGTGGNNINRVNVDNDGDVIMHEDHQSGVQAPSPEDQMNMNTNPPINLPEANTGSPKVGDNRNNRESSITPTSHSMNRAPTTGTCPSSPDTDNHITNILMDFLSRERAKEEKNDSNYDPGTALQMNNASGNNRIPASKPLARSGMPSLTPATDPATSPAVVEYDSDASDTASQKEWFREFGYKKKFPSRNRWEGPNPWLEQRAEWFAANEDRDDPAPHHPILEHLRQWHIAGRYREEFRFHMSEQMRQVHETNPWELCMPSPHDVGSLIEALRDDPHGAAKEKKKKLVVTGSCGAIWLMVFLETVLNLPFAVCVGEREISVGEIYEENKRFRLFAGAEKLGDAVFLIFPWDMEDGGVDSGELDGDGRAAWFAWDGCEHFA
ncbi:hypothetical protein MKZ38_010397 [Zalerion maritima]|uniref:Uncharacterized protein n=1 Tax=Zalerion maritima TaxID=339359 RepID=A0AAD5WT05_9PEZI|nr:hypothetical protein MKZ38_010397 [Zalerion maritima]